MVTIAGGYVLVNLGITLKSFDFAALAVSIPTAPATALAEVLGEPLETYPLLSALETDPLLSPMGRIFATVVFLGMFCLFAYFGVGFWGVFQILAMVFWFRIYAFFWERSYRPKIIFQSHQKCLKPLKILLETIWSP